MQLFKTSRELRIIFTFLRYFRITKREGVKKKEEEEEDEEEEVATESRQKLQALNHL